MAADSDTFTCVECGLESSIDSTVSVETDVAEDYLVGQVVSECRIVAKVGEGGFGTVYKAIDQTLQRPVAVKVMLQSLSSNIEFVQKFMREAVTAAQLNHPNMVAIHKVGRDERRGLHFLVMEFVEGETLSQLVERDGVLKADRLIPIGIQCCEALATAHEAQIVHRDIKPDNIMIDAAGVVKITDFGLAKSLASDSNTTKVMGTPHYMSPEQFEGKQVDGRSDVYSLGVTFYYLLSKARPYEGENTVQIIYSILTQEPKALPDLVGDVPPALWSIIQRMIAKKAEDRYESLRETITDLRGLQRKATPDRAQCPECGAKNPKGRKFCRGCGSALLVKCPSCGNGEPARAAICSQCGADLAKLVKARKALQSGKRFKALGDLRRAEEALREALELDASNPEVEAELADITATIGESDRVKSEADDLLHTGDMQAALTHIDALLKKHPTAVEVREHRDRLRQQVATHRVNALVEKAESAAADGDVRRALERLDAALRADPDRADVRARRDELSAHVAKVTESRTKAVEALAAGRFEDAFALASEVLKVTPGDAAMEEVSRKARDSVESVDSLVSQGRKEMEARAWADALTQFEAALALHPGDAQLLALVDEARGKITAHRERMTLCRRLLANGDHAQAASELEALLAEEPDDAEVRSLLDACRQQAADAQTANAARAALDEAHGQERLGDLTMAVESLERAVDLDPASEDARTRLRELKARRRREHDVRELADEHLNDGRYDDAITALERLRDVNPNRGVEIDAEITESRERQKRVAASVRRAEQGLAAREFRRATEQAGLALDLAPRHPRASAIKKDAEKAVAAIDRFLAEADRMIMSEMFDDAVEVLDKARERGATRDEFRPRRAACDQGQLALLKNDATRSLVANDFEAAIAAYEQVLEASSEDADALQGKRSAERRLRILTTEPLALRLGSAAVVLMLLGLVQMTAVASTSSAMSHAVEVANQERDKASVVVPEQVGQLEPLLADAISAERAGDLAAALSVYERELAVEGGKFKADPELLAGVAFVNAVQDADLVSEPGPKLDAFGQARKLVGDRPDVRAQREALLSARVGETVDAWVAEVERLKSERPGDALALIAIIEQHAVAKQSPALARVKGLGDYLETLQDGDDLLREGELFAAAAASFQDAEGFAADAADRDVATQRLVKTGTAWMNTLRSMASEAQDDDAYFEVLRGLEEYGRTLRIERERALEDLRR